MPFPTLIFLIFGIGVGAALASGNALRISVRPILLTGSFAVYSAFLFLVAIPISVYFYVFHGDWFLLYLSDVRKIPSAIALIGFLLEGCIGVAGFVTGAALALHQRMTVGYGLVGLCVAASLAVLLAFPGRIAVVGSFTQYHCGFGLKSYWSSPVILGALSMGAILAVATAYLIFRLRSVQRGRP